MFTSSLGNMRFSTKTLSSYAVARMFPDGRTKVTLMKCISNPDRRITMMRVKKAKTASTFLEDTPVVPDGNGRKLDNNVSRARRMIYEYASCNPWQYFVTLTLGSDHDRTDLAIWSRAFSQWLRNYNRIHGKNVRYLLIPELHKDGEAWHMHGFFMGVSEKDLTAFDLSMHLPHRIRNRIKEGGKLYTWQRYADKFGYCCLEPIRDRAAVSSYVTKYITKDLARCVSRYGAHLYYCSKKLEKAKVLRQDFVVKGIDAPDFENDYVMIKWYDTPEEALTLFPDVKEGGEDLGADRFGISAGMVGNQNAYVGAIHGGGLPHLHRQASGTVL